MFFWSERWVQSPLWGRWAEDKPCRKLPRGHFLFSLLQKKRKKAQQVRVGFPVKSTDGSAHIRRLGTAVSLRFIPMDPGSDLTLTHAGQENGFFFFLSPPPSVFGLELLPLEIICPPERNPDRWQRSFDTPRAIPNTSARPSKHTCAAGRAVH